MSRTPLVVVLVSFISLLSLRAQAAPLTMTHSGYLLDSGDQPITNTTLSMRFTIYNVQNPGDTNGETIWTSNDCNVAVSNGYYSVLLGGSCNSTAAPLDTTHLPTGQTRYLEAAMGGVTLLPRMLVGTVPTAALATHALEADTVGGEAPAALHDATKLTGAAPTATLQPAVDAAKAYTDAQLAVETAARTVGDSADVADSRLSSSVVAGANAANAATSANTLNTLVKRDASGGFVAGTLNLAGLTLPSGAAGRVLTSDASGNASWQPPSGTTQWTTGESAITYSAGNVGIGTASPVTALHIASARAVVGGGTRSSLLVEGTDGDASLSIKSAGTGSYAYQTFVQGNAGKYELGVTATGDAAGGGVFYLNPTVQAGSAGAVFAIKGGNVGIGTTSPQAKLDVAGDLAVGYNLTSPTKIVKTFATSHAEGNVPSSLALGISDGSGIAGMTVDNVRDGVHNSQSLSFSTHHGGISTGTRMTIDKGGSVGIGTTLPAAKLDVNGDANVSGTLKQAGLPAFRARFAGTTYVEAPSTDMPFGTEDFDVGANYDPATYTFTAPVAGIYWFSTNTAFYASTVVGRRAIGFYVNGGLNLYADYFPNGSNGTDSWDTSPLNGLIKLNVGDAVTVRFFILKAGDQYWTGTAAPVGHFMGYLVTRQ